MIMKKKLVTLTATAIESEWTPAFASTTFDAIKPP
jgi:hypothetical protein